MLCLLLMDRRSVTARGMILKLAGSVLARKFMALAGNSRQRNGDDQQRE